MASEIDAKAFQCAKCGLTLLSGRVPVVTFRFLIGEPSICERCVALHLGISAEWKDSVCEFIETPKETNA